MACVRSNHIVGDRRCLHTRIHKHTLAAHTHSETHVRTHACVRMRWRADRFSWNVWPRQSFTVSGLPAGNDRLVGYKPGPWAVVFCKLPYTPPLPAYVSASPAACPPSVCRRRRGSTYQRKIFYFSPELAADHNDEVPEAHANPVSRRPIGPRL